MACAAFVALTVFFVVTAGLAVAARAAFVVFAVAFVVFVTLAGLAICEAVVFGAEEAVFCDALLRRSARADPEDFTMGSSRLARDESINNQETA
ncbi:hypothetical protein [Paraburkholderia sp. J12]|uniref:hypothetical protein n=1 Tax=Paraburkholderia sp. J12 TaxID=2805432 RepID=UPI002ABE5398|nr:hypothetical protein [Paraburkholderia sp. J12]